MTYTEALERAKTTPVMRPHWRYTWLSFEDGQHCKLYDDGRIAPWSPDLRDIEATDWIEAPKPVDEF